MGLSAELNIMNGHNFEHWRNIAKLNQDEPTPLRAAQAHIAQAANELHGSGWRGDFYLEAMQALSTAAEFVTYLQEEDGDEEGAAVAMG